MVGVTNKPFTARVAILHGTSGVADASGDYRRTTLVVTDESSSQRIMELTLNATQLGQLLRGEETVVSGALGLTQRVGRKLITGTIRAHAPARDADLATVAADLVDEVSDAIGCTDVEVRATDLRNMHRRVRGADLQSVAVWVWVDPDHAEQAARRLADVVDSRVFGVSP